MTVTVDSDIQAALCEWLRTASLANPISWPLVAFVPTLGTPYLDVHPVLRAKPDSPFMQFTAPASYRGIFQIDAVVPDGTGEKSGTDLAALVINRFAAGTQLMAGSRRLQIIDLPYLAAAVKDAPWIRFPVSVPYLVIA